MVLTTLALIGLAGSLYITFNVLLIERWKQRHQLPRTDVTRSCSSRVTVIFAARNEEEKIDETLRSLVAQDYDNLEIIAVNDRSSDCTAEILEKWADHAELVHAVTLSMLPDGWLGKCHALYEGYERYVAGNRADPHNHWLLFTDADVEFQPDIVRRAVAEAERREADHFVLFPQLAWHSTIEGGILAFFTMMLGVGFQFWRLEKQTLQSFVGIGAFNMVRRDLYERFGGHTTLRLEIADDMKLGYLAKKYGGRSTALYGEGDVRVRWREGAIDVVRGIIRSGFPGIDFSWPRLLWSLFGGITVFLLPIICLIIPDADHVARGAAAMSIALTILGLLLTARAQRLPIASISVYPLTAVLFLWGLLLSGIRITRQGGVGWRDTFYSIQDLKRGTVR